MIDTFTIAYQVPAEPLTAASVVAAVIIWREQQYPITVQRDQGRWLICYGQQAAAMGAATFPSALTMAHFNAYLYASELVELMANTGRPRR